MDLAPRLLLLIHDGDEVVVGAPTRRALVGEHGHCGRPELAKFRREDLRGEDLGHEARTLELALVLGDHAVVFLLSDISLGI